ncbi:MAG: hypothetical protein G01um101416_284 [Microgenomates group bacterium Gr01-1014_16]|nr:MAG: hypothetical protein G01um101416_284 [Microgenomates group bacterium Gr01-1014_16]
MKYKVGGDNYQEAGKAVGNGGLGFGGHLGIGFRPGAFDHTETPAQNKKEKDNPGGDHDIGENDGNESADGINIFDAGGLVEIKLVGNGDGEKVGHRCLTIHLNCQGEFVFIELADEERNESLVREAGLGGPVFEIQKVF